MKIKTLAVAAAAAVAPSAAFAQTADPLQTGMTDAFGDITAMVGTAGPLLLGVAASVTIIGFVVRMVRRAG